MKAVLKPATWPFLTREDQPSQPTQTPAAAPINLALPVDYAVTELESGHVQIEAPNNGPFIELHPGGTTLGVWPTRAGFDRGDNPLLAMMPNDQAPRLLGATLGLLYTSEVPADNRCYEAAR